MFAALSATNEAILRTEAESELFQRVCDAAVKEGGFRSAGALLPGDDGWLRVAAVSGYDGKASLSELKISVDPIQIAAAASPAPHSAAAAPAYRMIIRMIRASLPGEKTDRPRGSARWLPFLS